MNVVALLNSKGVTLQQASDWVQARLDQPGAIYSICLEFGINSTMLAEIVQPFVPGVRATEVEAFFVNLGFEAQLLRDATPVPPPPPVLVPAPAPAPPPNDGGFSGFFPQEFGGLLSFVSLNSNSGALSNSSLRVASLAQLTQDSLYWSLFSPASFGGEGDGVWTSSELGFSGLGNLPATAETLESLFYGSIIRVARSIDEGEVNQLEGFLDANEAALEAGNMAVVNSFVQQLTQAFSTPAAVPLVGDEELAAFLPFVTATVAQLVGTGGSDLFGGLLDII
jgi:hypothetical protein